MVAMPTLQLATQDNHPDHEPVLQVPTGHSPGKATKGGLSRVMVSTKTSMQCISRAVPADQHEPQAMRQRWEPVILRRGAEAVEAAGLRHVHQAQAFAPVLRLVSCKM